MCSPKTMLKIGVVIAVPLGMLFGMKGMMGDTKQGGSKEEAHKNSS